MKTLAYLFALVPSIAMAGITFPSLTRDGQELCLVRAYNKAHLAAHPNQKVKGVAVNLVKNGAFTYASIEVRNLQNQTMTNAGSLISKKASKLVAQMDGDSGRFSLTKLQNNSALLRVIGGLYVGTEGCLDPDAVAAGTATCNELSIKQGDEDSKMILELTAANGSVAKTCSEILDQQIYINE